MAKLLDEFEQHLSTKYGTQRVKIEHAERLSVMSRVYEGFLGKVRVRIGLCTTTAIQDPGFNFLNAFESADAKKLKTKVGTHAAQLEAARQRLKEFRHTHLHSQSSQFVQFRSADGAGRFAERVLNDMQGLFDYFKDYFV